MEIITLTKSMTQCALVLPRNAAYGDTHAFTARGGDLGFDADPSLPIPGSCR